MINRMPNQTMIDYKTRHESVLRNLIDDAIIPAPLIKDAITYALFPGGKRLRPLLVYLCGELLQVPLTTLDIIAAAIEIIHGYSLIHDDLPAMDNDDYRRGLPTCHRAFDEASAILAGDGMQALAIELLLDHLPRSISLPKTILITQELLRACGPSGMVSGQSLDLSLLQDSAITEDDLQTIHQLKTGQLILACFNMVIAAADSRPEETTALRQFASHLGLLFQMQDDYLDRYGQSNILGKGRCSDLANQKQTFASLYEQPVLAELIHQHITKAHHQLDLFGERGQALDTLLQGLRDRL